MNEQKILNGLSYISIIFAPFLFPLIVYLVSNNSDVKYHASRALKLHLLPIILTIIALIIIGATGLITNDAQPTAILSGILVIGIAILDVALAIYNLVIGIKILSN
ncbi:putative Tic20 family protein [Enterococcus sp. PF1-24]|uniref:DUF4870 domain-containing protein n=1 Tax=unclassified Enterococcus TaxID=2608891 RepID=UPI002477229B|nr:MULTISPECIES: DUF4870 domain-containing protein [unclassified Enterococcus]MDH6364477.1 putative Tic20 family protein [Enterococcus sp. PFB1-1]MDH6401646.1 putative Tic20 family protein [Enterococcus sp. PF1-24]